MPTCSSFDYSFHFTVESLAHTMVLRTADAFATSLGSWNEIRCFFALFHRGFSDLSSPYPEMLDNTSDLTGFGSRSGAFADVEEVKATSISRPIFAIYA